jgi:elongator complex protein 2
MSNNRFGEIGGTNLGFFGALWGKEGKTVLAHGWGGSFHAWTLKEGLWKSRLSISGHYGDVTSLAWEPKGHYLISVSTDQTARLHGSWNRNGISTWHELARPQIHGYDMEDVAFLSRLRYISGSEEKIVRVFDAPALFIESMRELGVDSSLVNDVSWEHALFTGFG